MTTKVDVTITATVRPNLLDQTLSSFYNNLFCENPDRYRAILNIDPIGESNCSPSDVVEVCMKYFKNVVYTIPKEASFSKAVIWTWKQVEADFVFHLEDDWSLNRPVKMKHMIHILSENSGLACLRMSKYKVPKRDRIILFDSPYIFQNGYFLATNRGTQFGLNPCLIKTDFVKKAIPLMSEDKNPEKQFRYSNEDMREFVMSWDYGIYSNPGQPALVTDIGCFWKDDNKFRKPDKNTFLKWEKTN